MRGHPDRAADVRADRERTETRGQRRARSARGAAGRPAEIPRVVRRPVDVVVALEIPQADRDIGLADDDGACRLQPRDHKGVFRRLEIPEMRKAPCRRQAGDVERFLEGHGNAEQRQPLAAAKRGIGGACGVSRAIEIANDDRVDPPVQRLDARDRMREQLGRGHFASVQGGQQCADRAVVQVSGICGQSRCTRSPLSRLAGRSFGCKSIRVRTCDFGAR